MKNIDKDTTAKRLNKLEKETGIAAVFQKNNFKEMNINEIYDGYVEMFKEKIAEGAIYVALKDMYDKGYFTRERRNVKRYVNGHQKTVNVIIYRPTTKLQELHNECDKIQEEAITSITGIKPELDLVPDKDKNRPAFKTPSALSEEEAKIQKAKDNVKKVQELCKPVKSKSYQTINNLMDQLTTGEALVKLYQGYRIVSAVSGHVYAIMDDAEKKGITSSARPGEILSFLPANEMEGMWRILDAPKTCPYCGSTVKLMQPTDKVTAYYMCNNVSCRARGPLATTPEEALRKFNARV